MQWTELSANGYTTTPQQHIFSFFSLISITNMERINKAALLINLLFFGTKKSKFIKTRRARCCHFILGIYLCVQRKKGLINIIPLKNKILDWIRILRSSRHLWSKSLTSWLMHYFCRWRTRCRYD